MMEKIWRPQGFEPAMLIESQDSLQKSKMRPIASRDVPKAALDALREECVA